VYRLRMKIGDGMEIVRLSQRTELDWRASTTIARKGETEIRWIAVTGSITFDRRIPSSYSTMRNPHSLFPLQLLCSFLEQIRIFKFSQVNACGRSTPRGRSNTAHVLRVWRLQSRLERVSLDFSLLRNPLRRVSATTHSSHPVASSTQAQRWAEELSTIPDGSQSRLFLESSSGVLMVDQTLSQSPHLFNGIEY
jgi:hypothetical protein